MRTEPGFGVWAVILSFSYMLFSIDLDPYIQPWGALSGEAGQGPLTRCDFNIDYEVFGGKRGYLEGFGLRVSCICSKP